MRLGVFSMSLNVADLSASLDVYRKLGFDTVAGNADEGWLILQNESCTLGLFKDHVDRNTLTFNPGWDNRSRPLEDFDDVRSIQERLRGSGMEIKTETDPAGSGPAFIVIHDPDGNPILIDQHVNRPDGSSA